MIKYSVSKSHNGDYWVLWKETILERAFCCKGIFIGKKRECYKELRKYKEVKDDNN